MILPSASVPFAITTVSAVAGIAAGLIYFAALRRSVAALTCGNGWFVPAILTMARLGGLVIALGIAAKLGAMPLLAAFVGFLIARGIAFRWTPEAS